MNGPDTGWWVLVFCALVIVALWMGRQIRRMFFKDGPAKPSGLAMSEPVDLTLASREQRITARVKAGFCIDCRTDVQAGYEIPSIVTVGSWFDKLLHRGARHFDRYTVRVKHSAIEGKVPRVCARHQQRREGLLRKCLADVNSRYADFAEEIRKYVDRYERITVDEIIEQDENEIHEETEGKALDPLLRATHASVARFQRTSDPPSLRALPPPGRASNDGR